MQCAHCSKPITAHKRKYCDQTCTNRAFNARRKADGRLAEQRIQLRDQRAAWKKANGDRYRSARLCAICSAQFTVRANEPTVTCGSACGITYRSMMLQPTCQLLYVHCIKCGGMVRTTHSPGKNYHPECRPPRHKVKFSITTKRAVAARDSNTCWLCLYAIDLDPKASWELRPSMDHVIPRSHGGAHTIDNLRLAHRICNALRQDNLIAA